MDTSLQCRRRKVGTARFQVNIDVQFSILKPQGAPIEAIGVVRNLSMRGALVETHAFLTTEDQLTLFVTLPNHAELLELGSCAVRWIRGHHVGIEFLRLDAEKCRQLMMYLSGIHVVARLQRETASDSAIP